MPRQQRSRARVWLPPSLSCFSGSAFSFSEGEGLRVARGEEEWLTAELKSSPLLALEVRLARAIRHEEKMSL
jgi:hypothetical protein